VLARVGAWGKTSPLSSEWCKQIKAFKIEPKAIENKKFYDKEAEKNKKSNIVKSVNVKKK